MAAPSVLELAGRIDNATAADVPRSGGEKDRVMRRSGLIDPKSRARSSQVSHRLNRE
jgi:hypothetical protein